MLWNIDPVLLYLNIGFLHLQVRWYGLCFSSAFLLAYFFIRRLFLQEARSEKDLDALLWYSIIGVVFGARLGHCLFYEPYFYILHPLEILYIWHGGLASHGAVVGTLLSLYFYSKTRPKQPYLWILDRVSLVVPLGGAFVRLGNFFNSEIIGKETSILWAVRFLRVDSLPRHPVQLYESLAYLVGFGLLFFVYSNSITIVYNGLSYRQLNMSIFRGRLLLKDGFFIGILFVYVFSCRFLLEFFKEPQVRFESSLILNMGQMLSIPLVLVGVLLLLRSVSFSR